MADILVTGGAGFLGSHLVDALIKQDHQVGVIDNLVTGKLENLARWIDNPRFKFFQADITSSSGLDSIRNCDTLLHLAANPDVRTGFANPTRHFDQNLRATFNMLEATRRFDVERFVFTSTSTVYGEPETIPTPESYSPLFPVSVYGASKLACESLMAAYANTYGFEATIFRLANVIGDRCNHGVVYELVEKLVNRNFELEVLGDGRQEKSFVHISDCVNAMIHGMQHSKKPVEIFNVGSEDRVSIARIAEVISGEMGLRGVRYRFAPGTPDGRGWPGDVRIMQLDIAKLMSTGWRPDLNSEKAVRLAARSLIERIRMTPAARSVPDRA